MTDYSELKTEIKSKMDALKTEMVDLGTKYFKEFSAQIFEDFPNVASFSWDQYTPYFNDGDECVFSINDYSASAKLLDGTNWGGYNDDDEEEEGLYFYSYGGKQPETEKEKLAVAVQSFLSVLDESTAKALFGDHTRVTINRDGTTETELYEHD